MQKAGKRINPKVIYTVEENKVELGQDNIKQAKPFFNGSLVGTIMKGLELELTEELPNVPIYFENTVTYGENSATKNIGPYYLKEKATYNADTKTYTHKLYDEFLMTMIEYKPIKIEYPTTVFNFFKKLCEVCVFTNTIDSIPNGERLIQSDIYADTGYTYRDVFTDIGQATATLFMLNGNKIEKCLPGVNAVTINDDILKNQNISLGEHLDLLIQLF